MVVWCRATLVLGDRIGPTLATCKVTSWPCCQENSLYLCNKIDDSVTVDQEAFELLFCGTVSDIYLSLFHILKKTILNINILLHI